MEGKSVLRNGVPVSTWIGDGPATKSRRVVRNVIAHQIDRKSHRDQQEGQDIYKDRVVVQLNSPWFGAEQEKKPENVE